MKANELSVGDWVYCTEFDKQVIDRLECVEDIRVFLENAKLYTPLYYIKPIPLTEEILKKNGLAITEFPFCAIYFDEDTNYNLELSENKEGDIYWSISFDEYRIIRLRYVHELQHALRLCGIKKEIELCHFVTQMEL